jgi:bleomycin hydrolase
MSISSNIKKDKLYLFSKQVKPHSKITNQQSSGRCWLFAALNMLRSSFIEKNNLKDNFEFSQSYLFFWDKFERINYFINAYYETKDLELNSQLVQFILKEPLGDGGQWQMFVNLVNKYGLVPKSEFPETKHSSNTRGINMVLTKKIREYCKQIRTNEFNKDEALKETFNILVQFLGKPPNNFTWEYLDKNNKYNQETNLTPITFFQKLDINLNYYVSIINDPRNEYDINYGVKYLGNVLEGSPVKHLNKDMTTIINYIKQSIDNNEPVWFGCDVSQFLNSKLNIMDVDIFNMEGYLNIKFNLKKKDRIEYCESLMTHAMLITGYNLDELGNINRFEIENSWGDSGPNSGYYTMTMEWAKEYLYQVSINKKYLNKSDIDLSQENIQTELQPWDPMGSLA